MDYVKVPLAVTAIGIVSGLRSMLAPAVVSAAAASGHLPLGGTTLGKMGSPTVAKALAVFAIGEMITDKLPFTPDRTTPGPLAARIVSGGVCGAAICYARNESPVLGSLLGGLAAIGGAFLGYHLRHNAVHKQNLPDLEAALIEDTIAVCTGVLTITALRQPSESV